MPNKKESFFSDLLKRLEEESITQGRTVEHIEEKKYFLIVCEGIRTEPTYFNYFKKFLPKHLLETIEVSGEGDNTINIVDIAIEKRDSRLNNPILPPYNEVWAIFDKDDFPNHRYDNAYNKALNFGIEPGVSNEAFELWYVLHFQFLDTTLTRHQYLEILNKLLGFKYEKNETHSKKVVESIFKNGNIRQAIKRAKNLEEMHKGRTPSNSRPYTRVYVLVEKILKYSKYKY